MRLKQQQLFHLMGRAPVPDVLDSNETTLMSGWTSRNTRKKRSQTLALKRNTLKLICAFEGKGTVRTHASAEHSTGVYEYTATTHYIARRFTHTQ